MEYKHVLTEEEVRRLVYQAGQDPQRQAMLRLVLDEGLTVAETAALRWEEVDLSARRLRLPGRTVPLAPEAAAALKRLGKGREWVFPSRRKAGEPMARMSVNRQLRRMLDAAGLRDLTPQELRNQYLLRALERTTLEEAVRITGVEAVTLRDNWREHGRGDPPRPTPAGSAPPDDRALEKALEKEGDTLDGRIIRLSWQGGLYLREIAALRWEDVSPDCGSWTVNGAARPVPPSIRPALEAWRRAGGEGFVVQGPRSGTAPDEARLSKRTAIFFSRHGLEGMSVSDLRGNGQVGEAERAALLELVRSRGVCSLKLAREKLGLTPNQAAAAAAALRREGLLSPGGEDGPLRAPGALTNRERFRAVLEESAGEALSVEELSRRSGLTGSGLYYYMKEAAASGRLQREGRSVYRVVRRF